MTPQHLSRSGQSRSSRSVATPPIRRRSRLALPALALAGLLCAGCVMLEVAQMNRIDLTELRVDGSRLYMAREINSRTLEQFHEAMAGAPQVDTLVFTVVPGSVDDEINLELGREIRKRGLATHLVRGGLIASGGVDLYLAGTERTMEPGAFVGVHSWATGISRSGADVPRDHPDHDLYLRYYEEIDISSDFYWFTLESAPAGDMHWMTLEELERYQMITRPLIETDGQYRGPFADQVLELEEELGEEEDRPTPIALPPRT